MVKLIFTHWTLCQGHLYTVMQSNTTALPGIGLFILRLEYGPFTYKYNYFIFKPLPNQFTPCSNSPSLYLPEESLCILRYIYSNQLLCLWSHPALALPQLHFHNTQTEQGRFYSSDVQFTAEKPNCHKGETKVAYSAFIQSCLTQYQSPRLTITCITSESSQ